MNEDVVLLPTGSELPAPLKAMGLQLRPVVLSDWVILERIKSPFMDEVRCVAAGKPSEGTYSHEQFWELLFVWTHPPSEVRAMLARGPEAWFEAVMFAADQLPLSVFQFRKDIVVAMMQNFVRSFNHHLN